MFDVSLWLPHAPVHTGTRMNRDMRAYTYTFTHSWIYSWLCVFGSFAKVLGLTARNCEGTDGSPPLSRASRKEFFCSPELGRHRMLCSYLDNE